MTQPRTLNQRFELTQLLEMIFRVSIDVCQTLCRLSYPRVTSQASRKTSRSFIHPPEARRLNYPRRCIGEFVVYLYILVLEFVDQNSDRIKTVVRGRVARCHFFSFTKNTFTIFVIKIEKKKCF